MRPIINNTSTNINFIDMVLTDAKKLCDEQKLSYRVVKIDGKSFMMTQDMKPNRHNFTVEQNKIVKVSMG